MNEDPRAIRVDEFLPYPPAEVWRVLTDSALMARWLMPNDFALEVGHTFTFQSVPIPGAGFGGVGHSEVLDFTAERMLKIAWRAAPGDESDLDSTVTFTLEPEGSGTRLFLVHDGFDPGNPHHLVSREKMGGGWPGVLRRVGVVAEEEMGGVRGS